MNQRQAWIGGSFLFTLLVGLAIYFAYSKKGQELETQIRLPVLIL